MGTIEIAELAKEVIIICTMITNNNYNRPTVNVDKIINCSNMYNEKLEIVKKQEKEKKANTTYTIQNSTIIINE